MKKQPQTRSPNGLWARASQEGKIGYLIAWLMGVPASILLIILLIRGG